MGLSGLPRNKEHELYRFGRSQLAKTRLLQQNLHDLSQMKTLRMYLWWS